MGRLLGLGLTPPEIYQRFADNVYNVEHFLLMQDPAYYWRQEQEDEEETGLPVNLSEEDKQILAEHDVRL